MSKSAMSKSKVRALINKADETFKGDDRGLLNELARLVKEGKRTGDIYLVGVAYNRIAAVCADTGDLDGCFTNAFKAVGILKETDDYETTAKAYISLGYAYGVQENNQMELAVYDKAYRLMKRHRVKSKTVLTLLNNRATCFHGMGDNKTAIRMLDECISKLSPDDPEDRPDILMFSINLADCHKDDGSPEKAGEILDSLEVFIDGNKPDPLVCDYFLRRALVRYALGDPASGGKCVDRALTLFPENVYPLPLYDDFRKIMHELAKHKDRARADKILGILKVYAGNNKGTVDQLIALRATAEYHDGFGETAEALSCFEKLDPLYEKRMKELTGIRMNVYNNMKNADAEIHKLKKMMKKNEDLASVEPMTKLLNRSGLLRVSSEFIESAKRRKQKIGAIFIDIDFFKEYNDTYGHAAGDAIIRKVADACRAEEKTNVRFARYGGDEFFGITRGLSDEEVRDVARRICRDIREKDVPHAKNPNGGRTTLSAGVVNVVITEKTDTIIEIANYADKALYHAKNTGKDAIYLLDHSVDPGKDKNAAFVKVEL